MRCKLINWNISVLILMLFLLECECKMCYKIKPIDDILPCPNYKNKFLMMDLDIFGDDEENVVLNGTMELKKPIVPGMQIELSCFKVTELGKEPLFTTGGDICNSIGNEEVPWFPLLEAFDIKSCDIPKDTYLVPNMKFTLNHGKDIMSHEFVGNYECKSVIQEGLEKLSCYYIQAEIQEDEREVCKEDEV